MDVKSNELYISPEGKIIHIPLNFFKEHICSGKLCFICAKPLEKIEVNDEHILPNWLLREFDLYDKTIVLPNGEQFTYSGYKIPCCVECNSFLGTNVEEPIKELLSAGYSKVVDYIKENGPWIFIVWMSLILFKTHYKDLAFNFHLDTRKGERKIADVYDWEGMHHIYTVARSCYTGTVLDKTALSTFYMVPARQDEGGNNFDYSDLYISKSIYLRYHDIVFVHIANDGCGVFSIYDEVEKIRAPLSHLQIKELFAKTSYISLLLKEQPQFYTEINSKFPNGRISGNIPEVIETGEWDFEFYGKLLYGLIYDFIKDIPEFTDQIHDELKKGLRGFLLDENGDFINTAKLG